MAIDTREKRASAVGFGFVGRAVSVTVNASKDQEWRQQAVWGYSGILADEPGEDIVGGQWVAGSRYSPGFKAGDSYSPGFKAGDSYSPGFQSGQVIP